MAQESVFRGIIEFFARIGVYDVILPFILVFTIVFAILEKTKIFGVEVVNKIEYTKKNLNAMVSFVVAFLVVASTRLVAVINEAMANVVLLVLVVLSFLILIGLFFKRKEEVVLEGVWRTSFMIVLLLGVILIFLNALGWLQDLIDYLSKYWQTNFVASVLLLLFIVLFILWVTRGKGTPVESSSENEGEG
ncbi:hypothetical protein KY330_03055 [Candidatus Woesearchaeota archaeon]|nr:hypothetical protein [Candidatus Woesearchaeota archaeon]